MELKIFTVYDNKAEAYLPPLFFKARGEAVRAFADTINDPNTTLGKHPGDYNMFQIGTFDDATSVIVMEKEPINIGNGLEYQHSGIKEN